MSKNASLALVIILGFTLFTWAYLYTNVKSEKEEYSSQLALASKCEEKGIYVDAVKAYSELLKSKPDDYGLTIKYAVANKEMGNSTEFIKSCNKAAVIDSQNSEPYLLQVQFYLDMGRLDDAFEVLNTAKANLKDFSKVQVLLDSMKGSYKKLLLSYDQIGNWNEDFVAACEAGKWGLVDSEGNRKIEYDFDMLGGYSKEEDVAPVFQDDEWYYVDGSGNRKLVPDEACDFLGTFGDGFAPASVNGKYGYINRDFEQFSFVYDYTGAFSNGVAAVSNAGKWALIGTDFKLISDFIYDDILLDMNGFCSSYGRIFAKTNDKYILVDCKGKQIGSQMFDDVKPFASKEPAAMMQGGKWGFVSQSGETVCEPKYEDALSYASGLSGYSDGKLWGVLNLEQEVMVEPCFSDMGAFSSTGTAPVVIYNSWTLIQMYEFIE